jgi:NDP-sugar pyrophosphorylase family protein
MRVKKVLISRKYMQALILAGGFGSRLMPVLNDRPKIMAPIADKPFLELLINNLVKQDIRKIVLALGYLSGQVSAYFKGKESGAEISFSEENIPLGTGGAVKNAQKMLEEDFFVINGDTFIDIDYKKIFIKHINSKADITIVLTRLHADSKGRGLITIDNMNRILSFRQLEKEENTKTANFTNCGIYIFNKRVLSKIKKGEKVSLEKSVIPRLIELKYKIMGFTVNRDFIDIGTPERYKKAQVYLKGNLPRT